MLRRLISGTASNLLQGEGAWRLSEINYLVVLTIARRLAPFANCKDTLVVLELIGENFTILPVIPVLLVVNKSPSWYVYPPSVICITFRLWWLVGQFYLR